MREFGLIFAGSPQQMTQRSPENFWLVTLPMMVLMGLTLHLPLILQNLSLLPSWAMLNKDMALLLLWSSLIGSGVGAIVYVGQSIPKPIQLPWKRLQTFFAYDLYTPQLYRSSIVFCVDWASRLTDWFDRHVVDGAVNLVGFVSLFSGEALKYGNSGQGQFYILTILIGLAAIVLSMSWSFVWP